MEMYSGPAIKKAALIKQVKKPSNRPNPPLPLALKAPGLFQKRKPYASPCGFPPHIVTSVNRSIEIMRMSLPVFKNLGLGRLSSKKRLDPPSASQNCEETAQISVSRSFPTGSKFSPLQLRRTTGLQNRKASESACSKSRISM